MLCCGNITISKKSNRVSLFWSESFIARTLCTYAERSKHARTHQERTKRRNIARTQCAGAQNLVVVVVRAQKMAEKYHVCTRMLAYQTCYSILYACNSFVCCLAAYACIRM